MTNLNPVQAAAPACRAVTPYEILAELFEPAWVSNAHLCERVGASTDWAGYRVHERFPDPTRITLPADKDCYFSIGGLSRESRQRGNGFVVRDYLVVLDDVAVKSKRQDVENLEAFGFVPTMVVETSPGSFQYFFRLDEPVERLNPDQADRLAALELIRARMADSTAPVVYGDTAVHDPARYLRLPFGINSKPKYQRADGSFPAVRLEAWNPGARVSLEQWATFLLGADWRVQVAAHTPGTKPASAGGVSGDRGASMDAVYVRLAARVGLDPHYLRPGVVGAICPNQAAHTNGDPTGFAFINPYRGHCQHEHCKDISAAEMMTMVEQRYENEIAAMVLSGDLVKDPATGRLNDNQGNYVPATGSGWMAYDEFVVRSPLTVPDLAQVNRSSEAYALRRGRTPDWMAQMNQHHATVKSMSGVLYFDPTSKSDAPFDVMTYTHFRAEYDNRLIEDGSKTPDGAGTAWLKHPARRSYSTIGMWLPGQEPAGALNLFQGLPWPKGPAPAGASCDVILAYIRAVIASGRANVADHVLNWFAWKVQNPLGKPGTNLVLFGGHGTGKSTLGKLLLSIFGRQHSLHVTSEHQILSNFNGHMEGKLAILADEAMFGKNRSQAGVYKALTTEDTMMIEHKGLKARQVANLIAFIFCSNSPTAVPVENGDRRATVLRVEKQPGVDAAYWRRLWECWDNQFGREAFMEFLLSRDVSKFDPRSPLDTPEKFAMASSTADSFTLYWLELVSMHEPLVKGWDTQDVFISSATIQHNYEEWCRRLQHRPMNHGEVKVRLDALCPEARPDRPTKGKQRPRGRTYPCMDRCLELAQQALGGPAPPDPSSA